MQKFFTTSLVLLATAISPAMTKVVLADVDPSARVILEETIAALRDTKALSFTANMRLEPAMAAFGANLNVKLLRGASPDAHSYQITGTFESLGGDDKEVNSALINGKTAMWLQKKDQVRKTKDGKDEVLFKANTLYIRPLGSPPESSTKVVTPTTAFREIFLDANPFAEDLKAETISLGEPMEVGGEKCQVLRISRGKTQHRIIAVSNLDRLPRLYKQIQGEVDASFTPSKTAPQRIFEFTNVVTDVKFTAKDLELKAPSGFTTDKVDAPAPRATPVPAAATPAVTKDPVPGFKPVENPDSEKKEEGKEEGKKKGGEAGSSPSGDDGGKRFGSKQPQEPRKKREPKPTTNPAAVPTPVPAKP